MMFPVIEEKRLKIYRLGYRQLLSLVKGRRLADCSVLEWPVTTSIPDGATVHHVYEDFACRCFNVVVSHESFPELAEFAEIPMVEGGLSFEMHAMRVVGDAAMADMEHLTTEQLQYVRDEAIRLLSQRTL